MAGEEGHIPSVVPMIADKSTDLAQATTADAASSAANWTGVAWHYITTWGVSVPYVQITAIFGFVFIITVVVAAYTKIKLSQIDHDVLKSERNMELEKERRAAGSGVPMPAFMQVIDEHSRQTDGLRMSVDSLRMQMLEEHATIGHHLREAIHSLRADISSIMRNRCFGEKELSRLSGDNDKNTI